MTKPNSSPQIKTPPTSPASLTQRERPASQRRERRGAPSAAYLVLKGRTRTATVTWLLSAFKGPLSVELGRAAASSWGGAVVSRGCSLLCARREGVGSRLT